MLLKIDRFVDVACFLVRFAVDRKTRRDWQLHRQEEEDEEEEEEKTIINIQKKR